MTYEQALERHNEDCKRCNYRICKMKDNANECLQETDIKAYEILKQIKSIIQYVDNFYDYNRNHISFGKDIRIESFEKIKELLE